MKQLTLYILTGFLLFLQAACNKDLSKPPQNAKVDVNAIVDQKTAQIALNGVYYRFANANEATNYTTWNYHEVPGALYAGYLGYGSGGMQDESNININSAFSASMWVEAYKLINAANGTIRGVNAIGDSSFTGNRKKEILAEARFLRAYGHYRLLVYFAQWFDYNSAYGVLLRDDLSALSNISKARSTVKESYDFIAADLDYAIANGPVTSSNYYVTRWAAMALKMRLLMNRAQSGDYAEVIRLGNAVMQSGNYVLENNLKDIFYTKGLSSKEVILGVKPQTGQELYSSNVTRTYYPGAGTLWAGKQALKDLLQNDPRASWMIGPVSPYVVYNPNTFYFLKYIAYGAAATQLSETAYAIRLSEVYLLQAEAIVRSGGNPDDARTLLKTVMSKAGVTDFTALDNATMPDGMLMQTYQETARNLVAEDGSEWTALLRFPLATVTQIRPTITTTVQYILPIPSDEFQLNPLIGNQNPGYNK